MPDQSPANPAFRILIIVSRPLDQKELPTIADQWALINGLAAVKAPVEIKFLRPPTIDGLRTEILSSYDVLHFDGHGAFAVACPNCRALNAPGSRKCGREKCGASLEGETPRGYLAFEQEDGLEDALSADELAEMLQTVPGSPTKLVVLSACESAKGGDDSLADSLRKSGVPCVLGMNVSVPLSLTIALAKPLYAGLGAGMTVSNAFKSGLKAISRLDDVELREAGSKDVKRIKAGDVPKLLGDGSIKLMNPGTHGSLILEKMKLFGVPDYDFVGEFIKGEPPKGRKGLIYQVIKALNDSEKLVVLTGQGGIGKSVLAVVAARRISWQYPGGVFWRSAAEIENLDLNKLLDAFDIVFGYEFRTLPLDAKQSKVLSYLQDFQTPSLIVVDNAEVIKDPTIWRFLEGLPQPSAALVTTREALSREGTQIAVHQMEPLEAVRLFILEARRRSSRFAERLTKQDEDTLNQIARLLDGHPLGIKLAAGLVSSSSLQDILGKIRAAPPKEVSDRFDFSYNTLTQSQKELLQRMAAFGGSVADWVIKAVSEDRIFEWDNEESLLQWREDLSELVQRSFVDLLELTRWDESGDEIGIRRYRLHPLMRQYASLKAGKAIMEVHRSLASRIFLEFAAQFSGNYDALDDEYDNISSSVEWAYNAEEWRFIELFAWTLTCYLEIRGYWGECRYLLERALKATEKLDDKIGRGVFLGQLGRMAYNQGSLAESRCLCQECLKLKQEIQDKEGVAQTLNLLGMMARDKGDIAEAQRFFQESMKVSKELEDKVNFAAALLELGSLALSGGDYNRAQNHYQESLKIAEELEDKVNIGVSLFQLGVLAYETDDLEEAQSLFSKSFEIAKELGDKSGIATSLYELGLLAHLKGDIDDARCLCQESYNIYPYSEICF